MPASEPKLKSTLTISRSDVACIRRALEGRIDWITHLKKIIDDTPTDAPPPFSYEKLCEEHERLSALIRKLETLIFRHLKTKRLDTARFAEIKWS